MTNHPPIRTVADIMELAECADAVRDMLMRETPRGYALACAEWYGEEGDQEMQLVVSVRGKEGAHGTATP